MGIRGGGGAGVQWREGERMGSRANGGNYLSTSTASKAALRSSGESSDDCREQMGAAGRKSEL
jgi:hypothetical protein